MQQVYSKLPLLFLAIIITSTSLAGCKKKDMSLKLNEPRNIKGVISYRRTFGDLNEAHLNIAQAIGIAPHRFAQGCRKHEREIASYRNK